MKSEIQIDTENDQVLDQILSPSLESRGKVDLNTETAEDKFIVQIETEGLGPLRGTTDNVFRLSSLAKKIYES